MLPTTPSPDWTTVSSRNRAPARPTTPSDAHGSTLPDDGNRQSRGRSARGRSGGTLTTIHEDGSHPRSRSLVTPPIPRHSAGPQPVTLMTPLHTAPPPDHHPPAFKWPRPHRTRPPPSPSDSGKGGTTPPGGRLPIPPRPQTGFFPTIPPYARHAEQQAPSPSAVKILNDVLSKHIGDWTLNDFAPLAEPTGRSILISLFIDFSHAVRSGGLSTIQRRLIAQRARLTHPAKLLELIKDQKKALVFINNTFLTSRPPPLELQLCPSGSPDLVANDGLRKRIGDANLTRGDLLQIILPFLQCYYSSDPGFGEVVRQMSISEISTLVYTPGAIPLLMTQQHRTFSFDTPCWYLLGSTPDIHETIAAPSIGPTSQHTLEQMGFVAQDFYSLPPAKQKTLLLSALPIYLTGTIPHSRIIDALVTFGNAAPDEMIDMLQPTRFNSILGISPLPAESTPQLYRYRLLFKHDNHGGSHYWRGSPDTVLHLWLRAVLPPLQTNGHSITLTRSPHEISQHDTLISTSFLPPPVDLHQYIYHPFPRHNKFKRFEVWLTSTHSSIGAAVHESFDPTGTATYQQHLRTSNLWVQHAERFLADTIPCVLLTKSISQDLDALIVEELQSRIIGANLASSISDPPFYTTWCSVTTSDNQHTTLAKCVMAHPLVAQALTEVLLHLPTPDTTPVTGDYGFLPIPKPSIIGDDARFHAITAQSEFSEQLISTQISGLPPTDWFHGPAERIPTSLVPPDLSTASWSQIIVRGSIICEELTLPSPIIKLSTDPSCTRCTLTAYMDDVEDLIRYTRLLFIAMSGWAGDGYTLTCHVSSAQTLLQTLVPHPIAHTPDSTADGVIRTEIRELRDLILAQAQEISRLASNFDNHEHKSRQFEVHLEDTATSVTGSITSTLSSASRSAMSQCQSFLASQSSTIASFLSDHSTQLSSLYARSNSSESRDVQLHNLIRTYTEAAKRRDTETPKTDLLRITVEDNTRQLTKLVDSFRTISTITPTLPNPSPSTADAPPDPFTETLTSSLTLTDIDGHTPNTEDISPTSGDTHSPPPSTLIADTPAHTHTPTTPPQSPTPPLTQQDTCSGCATPGGSLLLCAECHAPFHHDCLFEEIQSSDLLCRGCSDNRHCPPPPQVLPTNSDTPTGPSSDSSTSSSSTSDDDFTTTPRTTRRTGLAGIAPTSQRLSPRGLPPKRQSRLRKTTTQPNYSQSTLSFASKRQSSRINPDNA